MRFLATLTLAFPFMFASSFMISAEHARITLDVTAKGETTTAYVDQTPPEHGKNPRPIVKVKAGEPVKIYWMLTNVYVAFPKLSR